MSCEYKQIPSNPYLIHHSTKQLFECRCLDLGACNICRLWGYAKPTPQGVDWFGKIVTVKSLSHLGSSWIVFFPMVFIIQFLCFVPLFCIVLPCSMIRPLKPDAFFWALFSYPAPRPTSETRETRPPRPGALSSPNWHSLGFVGVGKSWMRYLMFSQARFANCFAPPCSFRSNSLGMFVFTFVLLPAVFCSWRCQMSQAACRVN